MRSFSDGWTPRAILFDLDDTLLKSSEADSIALKRTLEQYRDAFHGTPVDLLLRMHSDLLKEVRDVYHKTGLWSYPPERLARLLRLVGADAKKAPLMGEAYFQIRLDAIAPYDGVPALLAALRREVPLGIVSNGPKGTQHEVLKRLNLRELFEPVVVAGEVGVRKPDPEIFLIALDELKLQPRDVLMVGDSYQMDVVPARRLGMRTALVTGAADELRLRLFDRPGEAVDGPCDLRLTRVTDLAAALLNPA